MSFTPTPSTSFSVNNNNSNTINNVATTTPTLSSSQFILPENSFDTPSATITTNPTQQQQNTTTTTHRRQRNNSNNNPTNTEQQQSTTNNTISSDMKIEDSRIEAVTRLLDYINSQHHWIFNVEEASKQIHVEKKKLASLVAVIEGLRMIKKVSTRTYEWIATHPPEHIVERLQLQQLIHATTIEKEKINELMNEGMAFVRPKALRHIMPGNTLIVLENAPEHTLMELSIISAWNESPRLFDPFELNPVKRYRLVLRCPTARLNTHILHPTADVILATSQPVTIPTYKVNSTSGLTDWFGKPKLQSGQSEPQQQQQQEQLKTTSSSSQKDLEWPSSSLSYQSNNNNNNSSSSSMLLPPAKREKMDDS
jgi:hypothetical protein